MASQTLQPRPVSSNSASTLTNSSTISLASDRDLLDVSQDTYSGTQDTKRRSLAGRLLFSFGMSKREKQADVFDFNASWPYCTDELRSSGF